MARADSSLSKNVEQELTCAVCCELYSSPLLLQCSHSFCKKCIRDLERNEDYYSNYSIKFKCPVCRAPNRLGIDRLPENLALSNLVTVLKTDEGKRALSAAQPIPSLNSTECWKHPNNDLDQYCVYCLKAFCPVCPKLKCDTEKHWLKPLDVHWKTTWESLTALSGEVGDRMSSLSDRMQLLDDQLAAVDREEDTAKSELMAEIEVLKSILMSRMTKLTTDLHSEVQDVKYPLTHDRQKCSFILDRMERLNSEMQDLCRCNNGVKSVKRITELEKEMSSLVRQESRDMLQQAIPVVTMPTWKLVRSQAETSIRNLIVRCTNHAASDSVSRVKVSPTSPMRTSPDHLPQTRSRRGELDSDVTMWTSSIPQPQTTRQIPCSSQSGGQRTIRVKVTAQRSSASTSFLSVCSNSSWIPQRGTASSNPREDTSVSASFPSALTDCYNSIETSLKKLEVSAKHFTYKGSEHVAKMLKKETKGFKGYQTTCPNSFNFGSETVFGSGHSTRVNTLYSNSFQASKQWGSVFAAPTTTISLFGSSSNTVNKVDFFGRGRAVSSSPSGQRQLIRSRHSRTGRNTGFQSAFTNGDPFSTTSVPEALQPQTVTLGSSAPPSQSNPSTGQSSVATKSHLPTDFTNGGSFSVNPAANVPHSGPERSNLTVTPHLPEQSGRNGDVNFASNFHSPEVFFTHSDTASQGTINTGTSQQYVPGINSLWTNGHFIDNTVTVMSPGYGLPLSTSVPGSSGLQPVAFLAQPLAGNVLFAAQTSTPTQCSESFHGSSNENVSEGSRQVTSSATTALDTNAALISDSATTLNSNTATLSSSAPALVSDSATTLNSNTATLSSSAPALVSDSATTLNSNTATLSTSIPTQVPDSATTLNSITTTFDPSIPTQVPDSATTTMSSSPGSSEPTVNNGPDVSENSSMVSCSSVPVQPTDSRCSTPCQDEQSLPGNHQASPPFTDSDSGVIVKDKQPKNPGETVSAQKSETGAQLFVNDNNSTVQQISSNQVVNKDKSPSYDASCTSSSTASSRGSSTVSSAFQFGQTPSVSAKSDNSKGMFIFGDATGMSTNTGFRFTPENVSAKPEFAQTSFQEFSFPSELRNAARMQPESRFQFATPWATGFQFGTSTSSVSNKLVFGFPGDTASTAFSGFGYNCTSSEKGTGVSSVNAPAEPKLAGAAGSIPKSGNAR